MTTGGVGMLFVSILTSDRARDPELWATIWQGAESPGITLLGAYNLANNKRIFIWEGRSVVDLQFMDRFNEVGVLETYPAFDRTQGWQMAFNKDLEGLRRIWEQRGRSQTEIVSGLDLRRRGLLAPNRHAARAAARQWREEQAHIATGE
jgi:hypothetical protein